MPKPTFYRLPQEKRIALLDSAKKEFQTYLLKDASINRIIQKAGISRGGFYLYFENIEDIYFYLLDECIDNYMKHFFIAALAICVLSSASAQRTILPDTSMRTGYDYILSKRRTHSIF